MPLLTRWLIKTSLIYLALGLLAGVWQAVGAALPAIWAPPGLRVVMVHLLAVGWLTLLIFGVALWMFPKFSQQKPRGPEWLGWAGYGLLNAGLVLRLAWHIAAAEPAASIWGWALVASAVLQWLGGLAFAAAAWGRVKVK